MKENNKKTNALEKRIATTALEPEPSERRAISIEDSFQHEISLLIQKAGTIKLTPKQKEILYAPVKESDVEIRPDGLIYLPWMEYVTRLRTAFDMRWSIIPKDMPKIGTNGKSIMWGFYLIIEGKLAGFAIGEQEYRPDNPLMNWSDACEAAKSNALMRLCKGLGISLELWRPSFIKKWKAKYAESYWDEKKKKYLWRKKGEEKESQKEKVKVKKSGEKAVAKRSKAVSGKEYQPPPGTAAEEAYEREQEKRIEKEEPEEGSVAKEKEDRIEAFKQYLEEKTIDVKRFKLWLGEIFGPQKKREFVGKNQYGHWSFHCGKASDQELMSMHFDWVVDQYIDYEKEHPKWWEKFEVPKEDEQPPF